MRFGDPLRWLIVKRFGGWYICPPVHLAPTYGGNGEFPTFEDARAAFAAGAR